jgi:pyruvate dehydrogenase E2 component (dihydrolipoamide acetyltransferase)
MARVLRMPEVAANAMTAVLSAWPLPENSAFVAGDALVTVETDKAVVDVQADASGVILKTLVAAGSEVPVGEPIAVLGEVGEVVADLGALLVELGVGLVGAAGAPHLPAPRIFSSPLARRMARDAGLALADLQGTGPGGRIVRRDVETAAARTAAAPIPHAPIALVPTPIVPTPLVAATAAAIAPAVVPPVVDSAASSTDLPHTRLRRAIAVRLTESKLQAPHFYLDGTAQVDRLLKLRARLNKLAPVKISINDLVVTAAARAHVLVPAMNVIWTPEAVRTFTGVDVAVAVATDRGLVTPVLRAVERMTVSAVAVANRDLILRARSGHLRDDELVGGTLTITNLGGLGTRSFTAIINPPQSAVLAVGAARPEPVVRKGLLAVGTVMHVSLSVDHRPIDGIVAAEWMAAFLALVEDPIRILA